MKNQLPQSILALLIFLSSTSANATNLIDLFNLAVENDPILKAAQATQKAQQEAGPQTLSNLLPRISISAKAGKASHDIKNAIPEVNKEKQISNEIGLALRLTQPIFNLPALRERKSAVLTHTKSELQYRIAQQDLLFRVTKAYFNTLSLNDRLKFARAERNSIAKLLKKTQKKFDRSEAEAIEVLETEAKHSIALAKEIKLESNLVSQRDALMRIANTPLENLLEVKANAPLIPPSPSNMEDWMDSAKAQNLQIAAKKLDLELIKQDLNVIRAKRYPTLDFNASYGMNDYGGAYPQESLDAVVSLDLNMTLYDGNKVSIQLRKKQHDLERITHELESKMREVMQSTRSAYLGVLAGISYVKALNKALDAGEKALRAVIKGFEKGEKSAVDVLNVQQEYFKNQQEYASSRYEYILSMLRLKHSVGMLSIDDLEQINTWLN